MQEWIGEIAYKLDFLDLMHIFTLFVMCQCYGSTFPMNLMLIRLRLQRFLKICLIYKEKPMEILEHREHQLRKIFVPMVKIRWQHHRTEEAIW